MRSDDNERLCALTKWYWKRAWKWMGHAEPIGSLVDPVTGEFTSPEFRWEYVKNRTASWVLAIAHNAECDWAKGVKYPKMPTRITVEHMPAMLLRFFRGTKLKFSTIYDGRKKIETVPLPE